MTINIYNKLSYYTKISFVIMNKKDVLEGHGFFITLLIIMVLNFDDKRILKDEKVSSSFKR